MARIKSPTVRRAPAIRHALTLVRKNLRRPGITQRESAEEYGAQQALCWVLRDDAAHPASLVRGWRRP